MPELIVYALVIGIVALLVLAAILIRVLKLKPRKRGSMDDSTTGFMDSGSSW